MRDIYSRYLKIRRRSPNLLLTSFHIFFMDASRHSFIILFFCFNLLVGAKLHPLFMPHRLSHIRPMRKLANDIFISEKNSIVHFSFRFLRILSSDRVVCDDGIHCLIKPSKTVSLSLWWSNYHGDWHG